VVGGSDQAGGVGIGFRGERIADAEELVVEDADDLAAKLVGVTMGEEGGVDVGAFGPFPKELFEFLLGFGVEMVQTLLIDGNTAREEFAAAEGDNVGEQSADFAELGLGVVGRRPGLSGGGEAKGNPVDKAVNDLCGRDVVEWGGIFGSLGKEFGGGLADSPLAEAAFSIFGEVPRVNGLAFEGLLEERLDFGQGIEPGEDSVFGLAVVESAVKLVANIAGEAGDFAGHGVLSVKGLQG
jgi:hypothetical protein